MKLDIYQIDCQITRTTRARAMSDLRSRIERKHDVAWTIIDDHEPDTISDEELLKYIHVEKSGDPVFDAMVRPLSKRQVSNALKHRSALQAIAKTCRPDTISMVVEDDPLLTNTFEPDLELFLDRLPQNWDFILLGLPGKSDGFQYVHEVYKALPVCNAYIVKPHVATLLNNTFLPIRFTTNIHISSCLNSFQIKPHLYSPHIILDGSKYGVHVSTLTANNDLFFNREYMLAKNLIQNKEFEKALETLAESSVRAHPDFLHLQALCELNIYGAEKARKTFKEAMAVYDQNNAVITNESLFLNTYITSYQAGFRPA